MIQLCASDDPNANLPITLEFIRQAALAGAQLVLTPEVTNCVSQNRKRQLSVLNRETDDNSLTALQAEAAELGIWLLIGSLALKTNDPDSRFANRSFLISPKGRMVARYDKIHMFDVQVSEDEIYNESSGYRPGEQAVMAQTEFARIGMTICYDIRFPELYRDLAKSGAQILTVPSAFSPVTGAAHWQVLLQARAIETGCFVLAPAQSGLHSAVAGKPRRTWGHSLAISPWGEVLADGGTEPGVIMVDLDLADVDAARTRIPSLTHDRPFEGPR